MMPPTSTQPAKLAARGLAAPATRRPDARSRSARTLTALSVGTLLAGATAAQTLSPPPEAGLWEHRMSMLLNGQDMIAQMRRAQEEMMKSLPPAQRAQMGEMMKGMMGDIGAPQKVCITPQDVARGMDPKQMLADLSRDQPKCRFTPGPSSATGMSFTGRCDDADGFTGDITGELRMNGARAWTMTYNGKGQMAGMAGMAGMPGMPAMSGGGGSAPVDMRSTVEGRWLASDCGDVKPEPR